MLPFAPPVAATCREKEATMTSYETEHFRTELFPLAMEADRAATRSVELGEVWRELASEQSRIAASFHTAERCYLVLRESEPGTSQTRLSRNRIGVFERVLLEASQNAVALECGVAPSTVALASRRCLQAMGLSCRAFAVPLLLVMAAHAANGRANQMRARLVPELAIAPGCRLISVKRPDAELFAFLSPAEAKVARLLVDGMTYAEISVLRETSLRTVANQLTATFRRLGVSGRLELLRWLSLPVERRRSLMPAAARPLAPPAPTPLPVRHFEPVLLPELAVG
jgi:DNA-binding CsgD family transcriptional regulator